MAEPLVTDDVLYARLGRSLTIDEQIRATALLADASAAVRAYTGQQFTEATTTTRFRVRPGRPLELPQRPVTDVSACVDVNGTAVSFTFDGIDRVEVWTDIAAINGPSFDTFSGRPLLRNLVSVTYTHGYTEIPDDIVAVVCQVAGRAMGRSLEDAGLTTTQLDGYSETYAAGVASGVLGLLPDERAVLDRYVRGEIGSSRLGYGYGLGSAYR